MKHLTTIISATLLALAVTACAPAEIDNFVDGLEPVGAVPSFEEPAEDVTPPVGEPTEDATPPVEEPTEEMRPQDEVEERNFLGLRSGDVAIVDLYEELFELELVQHSSASIPAQPVSRDETTLKGVKVSTLTLSSDAAWRAEEVVGCGEENDDVAVVCNGDQAPLEAGEYVVFETAYEGAVKTSDVCGEPGAGCGERYQYGFVLRLAEADAYESRRYVYDFFNHTNLWFTLNNDQWGPALSVVDASDDSFQLFPIDVRLYIQGDRIVWMTPVAPWMERLEGFRSSAFRHTGDFGFEDPWAGSVYPPLPDEGDDDGFGLIPSPFRF